MRNGGHPHPLSQDPVVIEQIVNLRKGGLTLQEIGDRFGVGRERIRQILEDQLTPTEIDELTEKQRRLKSETLVAEQTAEAIAQADEIFQLFMDHNGMPAIARQLNLSVNAVRRILHERIGEDGWSLAHRLRAATYPNRTTPVFTDEAMLEFLRRAHAELDLGDQPMKAVEDYDDVVRCRRAIGEHWPKSVTILIRLGGWSNALAQAGLPHGKLRKAKRSDYRPTEQVIADLFRCGDELGEIPSVKKYDAWAKANPGAVSEAGIRQRLGSWKAVIDLFLEREAA